MPWPTITVKVPGEGVRDRLVAEFADDGLAGVWERDDEGGGPELVLYFELHLPTAARERIAGVFRRNGDSVPAIEAGTLGDADWSLEWRRGFTSFPLGSRFRVVPSWEAVPVSDDRIPIRIDPGMAFGTGTHETTRMVVELMEDLEAELGLECPVLDLGTGSGILAIVAGSLGARRITGCDTDADAIRVARENVERNHAAATFFVGSVDAVQTAVNGVVLANLTADVLLELLPDIRRVLSRRGCAVLSGILRSQEAALRASLADAGMVVSGERAMAEWMACRVTRGD